MRVRTAIALALLVSLAAPALAAPRLTGRTPGYSVEVPDGWLVLAGAGEIDPLTIPADVRAGIPRILDVAGRADLFVVDPATLDDLRIFVAQEPPDHPFDAGHADAMAEATRQLSATSGESSFAIIGTGSMRIRGGVDVSIVDWRDKERDVPMRRSVAYIPGPGCQYGLTANARATRATELAAWFSQALASFEGAVQPGAPPASPSLPAFRTVRQVGKILIVIAGLLGVGAWLRSRGT